MTKKRLFASVTALGLVLIVLLKLALMEWNVADLLEWLEDHPWLFFLALAILPAFGLPTTPMYLAVGVAYSLPLAIPATAAAIAANLALCFWLGHSYVRPLLIRLLRSMSFPLPQLEQGQMVPATLVVKFTPGVPATIKNYLLVLAGVPFMVFFTLSFVISGGYALGFILLGESLLERDWRFALVGVVVLIVVLLTTHLIRRKLHRGRDPVYQETAGPDNA